MKMEESMSSLRFVGYAAGMVFAFAIASDGYAASKDATDKVPNSTAATKLLPTDP